MAFCSKGAIDGWSWHFAVKEPLTGGHGVLHGKGAIDGWSRHFVAKEPLTGGLVSTAIDGWSWHIATEYCHCQESMVPPRKVATAIDWWSWLGNKAAVACPLVQHSYIAS